MARSFAGAGVALITPFTKSGDLDEAALRRTLRRQIESSIDVLVPCGTTGEAVTMTPKEQLRVIEITVEEAGGAVPVLAGTGTNDTRASIEKSKAAAAAGAAGVLCVGPYYNKPTPEGFYRHYTAIAEASRVPVVVYNVPGRTGSNIDTKTLLRIATHKNVGAVKEASGNLGQIMEILRDRPPGFQVLSGDDAFAFAVMALGGEGVVSVCANQVPREMHAMASACAHGDFASARKIHCRLLHLMNLNFSESNPVPVKAAMALLGLCEEVYRLPLCPPSDGTRMAMRAALKELELLP
jgi:4-hydroxy-tetrahydrodipicolinate synthase